MVGLLLSLETWETNLFCWKARRPLKANTAINPSLYTDDLFSYLTTDLLKCGVRKIPASSNPQMEEV